MTVADGNLHDLRCHTCGRLIGHTAYYTPITTWCNQYCANTPLSRTKSNQSRDELIIAMFMERRSTVQIGDELGLSRQNVQQILGKRGVDPFPGRDEVAS